MSHYAKIENGLVTEVVVAEADFIATQEGQWVQTSYNTHQNQHSNGGTALRGNFASIGYTYDQTNDVFYAPQPFASWVLNDATWSWEAPIQPPTTDKPYEWNETNTSWIGEE